MLECFGVFTVLGFQSLIDLHDQQDRVEIIVCQLLIETMLLFLCGTRLDIFWQFYVFFCV